MPSSEKRNVPRVGELEISQLKEKQAPATHVPKGGSVRQIAGQNIVTVDVPTTRTINSFEPEKIKDGKGVHYSDVVTGSSDATAIKNSRFRISELARGPLSVAAEEEARIEEEVKRRLDARLATVRESATKSAYEEGLSKGRTEGRAAALEKAKPMIDTFEGLIAQFENMSADIFKANEEFLIRLVYRCAKAVILKEMQEDTAYTRRLITQLIERLGTKENIKIFVGQKEYSSAEALKAGLAQTLGQLKNISVELDSTVTDRGCRIETDFGEVDARIEVQLQALAATLGVTET
jgi:flagellar assembly protein FliH